ncbi:hypothetical protein F5Y06DRAFT_307665 [Hypoxylon sp. FL0890]|nr:hypothetical protein F5Y06DRAFT_307665 [Hypoxylon sp. FL0890]
MATKQSRQHRKAYCERAKRRDPTVTSFFARRANRNQDQYESQNEMPSTTTFNTKYLLNRDNNEYGKAAQPTTPPQTPIPASVLKLTMPPQPRSLQPATRNEIYGLAFGTSLLILLMGWFFLVGLRTSFSFFTKKSEKANQEPDPENGPIPEAPEQNHTFLSKLRKVSTEELIKSARQKSLDIATGIKRDIGEFRRLNHSACHRMDEESGLIMVERGRTEASGPFLRRKSRVKVA